MKFYTLLALASLGLAAPIAQDTTPTEDGVAPTGTGARRPHGTGDFSGRPSGVAHETGRHHSHEPGHAKPTGGFNHSRESGHAKPTGAPILPRQDASATDANAAPTGTHLHRPHGTGESSRPSGVAKESGHHHSHESGHTKPTGGFGLESGHAKPTGVPVIARQDGAVSLTEVHSHESGHAKPTGAHERPSGVAHPSGHGERPLGVAHPSGHAHHSGHKSFEGSLTAEPTAVASADPVNDTTDMKRRQDDISDDTLDDGVDNTEAITSSEIPAPSSLAALPTETEAKVPHRSGHAHPTGSFSFGGSGFPHPTGFHHSHVSGAAHATGSGKVPHFILPSGLMSEFSGHAKPSEFLPMMTKIMSEIAAHETGAPIASH